MRKAVQLVAAIEEAVETALRGSNVDYTLDIASDLPSLEADEEQLIQALTNVLINARQAMTHGGAVAIRAETVTETRRRSAYALQVEPGRYVRVSIADHGTGRRAERSRQNLRSLLHDEGPGKGPRSRDHPLHRQKSRRVRVRRLESRPRHDDEHPFAGVDT